MKKIALAIIAATMLANSAKAEGTFTLNNSTEWIVPATGLAIITSQLAKDSIQKIITKYGYKYQELPWYKKIAVKYPKLTSSAIYLATFFGLEALNKNNANLLVSIFKNNSNKIMDFGKNLINTSCTTFYNQ